MYIFCIEKYEGVDFGIGRYLESLKRQISKTTTEGSWNFEKNGILFKHAKKRGKPASHHKFRRSSYRLSITSNFTFHHIALSHFSYYCTA